VGLQERLLSFKSDDMVKGTKERKHKKVRVEWGRIARVGDSPYLTSGQLTATNVARPGVTRRTNELMFGEEKAQEDVIEKKKI
jgi:hypothetical protein